MREDMFKVIVERPRRGWRSAPHKRGKLSADGDLPTKIGVRRHVAVQGIRSKWLNENLNPLRRFLGRQVGRPWDKVYSEIAATLAPGHTVKEHVRQHLDDFVALKVSVGKDGTLMNGDGRSRWWRGQMPWRQHYYVDPNDGLLKESAKLWKKLGFRNDLPRDPKADPNLRVLDKMRELRCIDGIWYEVLFNRNRDTEAWAYDLLKRERVRATERHAVAKRQLSRTELDAFGIKNSYND